MILGVRFGLQGKKPKFSLLLEFRVNISIADWNWLTSEAGQAWIARAAEVQGDALRRTTRLRKELSRERTALVVEQVQLRERARSKFTAAERMLFTSRGLEQATDEHVAAYKAERFAGRAVADLCCGIGGDAMAIAQSAPRLTAVDQDPRAALLTEFNVRAAGTCQGVLQVECRDAADFPVADFDAWHLDPDRRPDGKRTVRPERMQPGLEVVEDLRKRQSNAAVKWAPATRLPSAWEESCELEWISRGGECRQLVSWCGELAERPGRRKATVLAADGSVLSSFAGEVEEAPVSNGCKRYVYEPDAALLAADLAGAIANRYQLERVSAATDYLTGDDLAANLAWAAFEVREILPFDEKRLRKHLRTQKIGRVEIKKRGVSLDPAGLQRRLRGPGDASITMLVTPIGGQVRAILANRVASEPADQKGT